MYVAHIRVVRAAGMYVFTTCVLVTHEQSLRVNFQYTDEGNGFIIRRIFRDDDSPPIDRIYGRKLLRVYSPRL